MGSGDTGANGTFEVATGIFEGATGTYEGATGKFEGATGKAAEGVGGFKYMTAVTPTAIKTTNTANTQYQLAMM